jgi:hypothetical protein
MRVLYRIRLVNLTNPPIYERVLMDILYYQSDACDQHIHRTNQTGWRTCRVYRPDAGL